MTGNKVLKIAQNRLKKIKKDLRNNPENSIKELDSIIKELEKEKKSESEMYLQNKKSFDEVLKVTSFVKEQVKRIVEFRADMEKLNKESEKHLQ